MNDKVRHFHLTLPTGRIVIAHCNMVCTPGLREPFETLPHQDSGAHSASKRRKEECSLHAQKIATRIKSTDWGPEVPTAGQNYAWELTQGLSWLIGRSDSKTFSFLEAELETQGSK
jgi:hypothetical protein